MTRNTTKIEIAVDTRKFITKTTHIPHRDQRQLKTKNQAQLELF